MPKGFKKNQSMLTNLQKQHLKSAGKSITAKVLEYIDVLYFEGGEFKHMCTRSPWGVAQGINWDYVIDSILNDDRPADGYWVVDHSQRKAGFIGKTWEIASKTLNKNFEEI